MEIMASTNKLYTTQHLLTKDLSSILLKESKNEPATLLERDAGFCSGSSENGDEFSLDCSRGQTRSPTDASEDSVEVKLTPIVIPKNKRKSLEPSKVVSREVGLGPLKKRIKKYNDESYFLKTDNEFVENTHFRPWAPSLSTVASPSKTTETINLHPAQLLVRHPGVTTLHRAPNVTSGTYYQQDQPLALLSKKQSPSISTVQNDTPNPNGIITSSFIDYNLHKPHHSATIPTPLTSYSTVIPTSIKTEIPDDITDNKQSNGSECSTTSNRISVIQTEKLQGSSRPSHQRNYKNMTRERRIEANARERTRVHTISAAFDTLRRTIPSYSNTQKLSKLSVLRVACSYILTLSRIAGEDYSADGSEPDIADCVEEVTKTIQTEGKIRKRKDE